MDQQTQFLADYRRQTLTILESCALYGVSRKTGYRWIERHLTHGPLGLEERSRQPHSSPPQTPRRVADALSERRRHHPAWGAKTPLPVLRKRHPRWPLPARSTACEIFRRNGLAPTRRPRRPIGYPGQPPSQLLAPNEVWSADLKGHCNTGDGISC